MHKDTDDLAAHHQSDWPLIRERSCAHTAVNPVGSYLGMATACSVCLRARLAGLNTTAVHSNWLQSVKQTHCAQHCLQLPV